MTKSSYLLQGAVKCAVAFEFVADSSLRVNRWQDLHMASAHGATD